jgi:DNA integrity scanning protein DisA with diadenylate cyclase activity
MKKLKSKSEDKLVKKIQEKILKVAIEIVREGNGALFVIGNNLEYRRLMRQKFEPFSVFDKGAEKTLKGLAVVDGAVIISKAGIVKDYGVMIKSTRAFVGHGTRHAAAYSASKKGNISIMCSEEERKVKIFSNGRYIMQLDALQKNIENQTHKIATMLETVGAGFIGTVGVATLAPALGIAMIPGVIIFGGTYYAIRRIISKFA